MEQELEEQVKIWKSQRQAQTRNTGKKSVNVKGQANDSRDEYFEGGHEASSLDKMSGLQDRVLMLEESNSKLEETN